MRKSGLLTDRWLRLLVMGGFSAAATWANVSRPVPTVVPPHPLFSVAASSNRIVAVGGVGDSGVCATSTNGLDWETRSVMVHFTSIVERDGTFVAVGAHGAAGLSTNGTLWQVTSITTNHLHRVIEVAGLFIASSKSDEGEIFTSRDGLIWQSHKQTVPVIPAPVRAQIPVVGLLAKSNLETRVTVTNRAENATRTGIADKQAFQSASPRHVFEEIGKLNRRSSHKRIWRPDPRSPVP